MRVAEQKSHVDVSEGIKAKEFGIVFDRHMVNILSNQLYEDKICAVVRELSTNAIDSQIEAGYDGPFDVHLPTWHEPEFWVRDYGTGMSPDKIDTVYRNYGKSDRQDSNDFAGCMGLGSKTPFCYYTKTFKVDSWYDGTHYQYACFLNEDGMPQIALMTQERSNEPSGVKVSLPTKAADEHRFLVRAQDVYKVFSQVPNIVSHDDPIEPLEYSFSGDNWKYCDDLHEGMKIVMGNVAYPVSTSPLGDLSDQQRQVVHSGFHVFVNIGDVAVTASREGLDYTNRTKTHVRHYINSIIDSFNKQIQDQIAQCKNLWEARLYTSRHLVHTRRLYDMCDLTKVTYNGQQLFHDRGLVSFVDYCKDNKVEVNHFGYSRYNKPQRRTVNAINPKSDPLFYVNDLKIGGFVRSIAEVQKHKRHVYLITFKDDKSRQEFLDHIGIDESYFTNISSIPSPTKRASGNSRGKTTPVMRFNSIFGNSISYYWKNANVDMDDGGKYVEFNRFRFGWNGSSPNYRPQKLHGAINVLADIGINVDNVYAVKTAHLKKFKNHPKWKDFYEWAVKQVKAKIKGKDLVSPIVYQKTVEAVGGTYGFSRRLNVQTLDSIAQKCNKNTKFYKFVQKVLYFEKLAKESDRVHNLRGACDFFGINIPELSNKVTPDIRKQENDIYDRYKLLDDLRNASCVRPDHVALYINAVDGIVS